jgi:hypothetical protein
MGPCLCGDVWCPSCGNPAAMQAAEDEMARVEATLGPDFEGDVWCSCGAEIQGASTEENGSTAYLYRACVACWEADHYEPEPDYEAVYDWPD